MSRRYEKRYIGFVDNHWGPVIRGWACEKGKDRAVTVLVTYGNRTVEILADQMRYDVRENGQHRTGQCGFSLDIGEILDVPAVVTIKGQGHRLPPSSPPFAGKKLFFMHIAKTGGSTINRLIERTADRGEYVLHFEGISDWNKIRNKRILSGHVSLPRFADVFPANEYIKYVLLRNPLDQLVSHLNWVRQLSEKGNEKFSMGHPEVVRRISRRLTELDFSSPSQMARFARNLNVAERGLFDNCQSRYFVRGPAGSYCSSKECDQALVRLREFQVVGLTENLESSVNYLFSMTGMSTGTIESIRENRGRFDYGFDKDNPDLRTAVEPLIVYDKILYREAQQLFQGIDKGISR